MKIKFENKLKSKQMATQQSSKLKTKAEKLTDQYEQRLREIKAIDINEIGLAGIEELCDGFELEMNTLNSKKAAILSEQTRATIKDLYLMITQQYRDIVSATRSMNDIICSRIEFVAIEEIGIKLTKANLVFQKLQLNESISESIKKTLLEKFNSQMQEITNYFINTYMPVEFRDSLFLIESTLAEPELYTLPTLIMWRETAKEKIRKIQIAKEDPDNNVIPEIIFDNIINKYQSMIKQLQAEILKLRTYPIPEPWCSYAMRKGLTHMIEGEFIFFVHPGIEEDMRPLKLSDRDLLPGGISRQEYDTRLNRVNTETALAIRKLEAVTNASDMGKHLEWFESSYEEIEWRVNFAFTELRDLYRDARSLEYLVDKNQDDELLKEIHDIVLISIRHFFDNRIDIPSVAIDIRNIPILTAPPMEERYIPTASGIDRGGDWGINLVTPASVVVVKQSVIVADGYGHRVSFYRIRDLWCMASWYDDKYDTPVSLTYFKGSLYASYKDLLLPYILAWKDYEIDDMVGKNPIAIPQISCTASNDDNLYVGTVAPSLLLINTDTNSVEREYPLQVIRYETSHKKASRYPWLQDMKAVSDAIIFLFTGSPSPLQMFSFEGELIRSLITEGQITEAYHFAIFTNAVTGVMRYYISDFWDNAIKVFDTEGVYIESILEEGTELCQISRPTGIFVEETGYITYCDMKENNCLQRL